MYQQNTGQYRMIGRSLFKRNGRAFIHVAVVPPQYKGVYAAIEWYENGEPQDADCHDC